jgi:hypothetical protein
MGKPNYVCSLCKKDFSRKSNANRHDLSQHQGKAEIIRIGEHVLKEKGFRAKAGFKSDWYHMGPQKARLYDTLEKLVPKFEELEKALSNNSSEEKQKILGKVIMLAIASRDPIRTINGKLEAIRKGSSVHRMINCGALSLGVPHTAAEEMLASMVFNDL